MTLFLSKWLYLCGETLKTTPKGLAPIQPSHWLVAEVCRHGSLWLAASCGMCPLTSRRILGIEYAWNRSLLMNIDTGLLCYNTVFINVVISYSFITRVWNVTFSIPTNCLSQGSRVLNTKPFVCMTALEWASLQPATRLLRQPPSDRLPRAIDWRWWQQKNASSLQY